MIKAELIQASNNSKLNVAIFTFKLTYPKKHWFLDVTGLRPYFERLGFVEDATVYATHTSSRSIQLAATGATKIAFCELGDQVYEIADFTRHIYDVVNSNGALKLSRATLLKAGKLFGTRLQEVLKQYQPGEMHRPSDGSPQGILMDHCAVACNELSGAHAETSPFWSGWNPL